ncbi:MAG TPA: NAD(P)H-hydrate dehydratase [Bacteroidales bacterium]|nr:NAD(P)H-hydrate dehydratase [Bacteroidales bacterium]
MKIFSSAQIKEIDSYTIIHEPVNSVNLMERAAGEIFDWYIHLFDRRHRIFIFAGPGNNGGDGLALARMLAGERYKVELWYPDFNAKTSVDWKQNFKRLKKEYPDVIKVLKDESAFPFISKDDVIIDAIFGSGLNRPADGFIAVVIRLINESVATRVSIDIPSGLFCEDNGKNDPASIIQADYTLSFEFPKLAFMFAENAKFTGDWDVLPIGLHESIIEDTETKFNYLTADDVRPLLKTRNTFDHKGMFGHGLLVAGSAGKTGAAILSAKAALRAGIGLLTCHLPGSGRGVMNTSVPEAMVSADKNEELISGVDLTSKYTVAAIGPGIGTDKLTQKALFSFLKDFRFPLIIDADALNLLSENRQMYSLLHKSIILTPHPKEFERLTGKFSTGYERLISQIEFSEKNNCFVVLKGAYTSVSTPEGKVYFNSTGNPGMATAGSGDVLTGIILSLLAQGYSSEEAAVLGVYLHGLAGDIAAEAGGYEALIASDIINNIGPAYIRLREGKE